MALTDALSIRNWLCGRGFILRAVDDQVRVIPFWRLSDEERAAVRRYERELVTLLSRGWLAARQEELAARSRALYAPDGSPRCWWCASPARGDGSHLCDACSVSRQVA